MAIFSLNGVEPQIAATAWVAEDATVIGNVILGEHVSIWPGAVLRGDQPEPITIGARSNIQDGSVLHSDTGQPITVGEGVTVGHQVVLHGCTIGDDSLVGIGAVVLNGSRIGRSCLIGARALVTEGKEFPDGVLIIGGPAKVARDLTPEQIEALRQSAHHYVENGERFRNGLKRIG